MDVVGSKLIMFRGDSETITFFPRDAVTKEKLPLVTGDTVKFTVRADEDSASLLAKTVTTFSDGEAKIPILPADTSSLAKGRYVYDIELTYANGDVKTVVKAPFVLEGDVTHA